MNFLNAQVLAQEEGFQIPPLEVRLGLQPGDRVCLYEKVIHPSMGAGVSPLEAVILGSPEYGWWIGETSDGEEISFNADQIVDVEYGSPGMGGIFDWFKRRAPKGAPPPAPGIIPLPQAGPPSAIKPEEQRGLISQLKTLLRTPLFAKKKSEGPITEKTGIFDVFKKAPAPPVGLPIERGEQIVTEFEKRESAFSIFEPQRETVIPFLEKMTEPMSVLAPEQKTIIPFVEALTDPFEMIPASPELEPFEVRQARQKEFWEGLFPGAEEPPAAKEVFQAFKPQEVQAAEEVIPPGLPKDLHRSLKVLPLPRRATLLPEVEDIARGFLSFYEPIEDFWNTFREERATPAWQELLETEGRAKIEFESIGACHTAPNYFQELSSFLHIPWEELSKRAVKEEVEEGGETYEEWADTDKVWKDVVFPAIERISEALNMLKPADLPGQFSIDWNEDHGCMLVISYVEEAQGLAPEIPKDVKPEDVARSLEEEIFAIRQELESLDPRVEGFEEIKQQLTSDLEDARRMMETVRTELEEPEEPKPTRAKKKKKGRKKKG